MVKEGEAKSIRWGDLTQKQQKFLGWMYGGKNTHHILYPEAVPGDLYYKRHGDTLDFKKNRRGGESRFSYDRSHRNHVEELFSRNYLPTIEELVGYELVKPIAPRESPINGQTMIKLTKAGERVAAHGALKKKLQDRVVQLAASIFLLAGFIFLALPDFTTTGNAIGSSS